MSTDLLFYLHQLSSPSNPGELKQILLLLHEELAAVLETSQLQSPDISRRSAPYRSPTIEYCNATVETWNQPSSPRKLQRRLQSSFGQQKRHDLNQPASQCYRLSNEQSLACQNFGEGQKVKLRPTTYVALAITLGHTQVSLSYQMDLEFPHFSSISCAIVFRSCAVGRCRQRNGGC